MKGPYFFIPMPGLWEGTQPSELWSWVSPYMVVYLGLLVGFGLMFFRLPFAYRFLYGYLLFFTVVYIVVDPHESNRMRIEVEPIYFMLAATVLHRWLRGSWPWQNQPNTSNAPITSSNR